MADRSRYPDTSDNINAGPDPESPPRTPRWVWVSALVLGVLIVLAAVVMLVSGGQHGPARHTSSSGTSSFPTVTEASGVHGLTSLARTHG